MKKKNHIFIYGLISAIVLLLSGILLYRAYSFYEEKNSFDLIHGKVDDQNYDVNLVYVIENESGDKVMSETIPEGRDYYVTVDCAKGAKGTWDYEKWAPLIENLGQSRVKCKINFAPSKPLFSEVLEKIPVVTSGSGMYQVSHPDSEISVSFSDELSEEEKNNLKKTELRYAGINPNNYVMFNEELWRVIGLVNTPNGQRVKLLHDVAITGSVFDVSTPMINNDKGINSWENSKIKTLLNEGIYYNRESGICYTDQNNVTSLCDFTIKGLQMFSKRMIDIVKWNYSSNGDVSFDNIKTSLFYNLERSNNTGKMCNEGSSCNDGIERNTIWQGRVGLIYPSDYGYATSGGNLTRDVCLSTVLFSWSQTDFSDCKDNNWILNSKYYQVLFMAANRDDSASYVYYLNGVNGRGNIITEFARNAYHVQPSIYLKENVRVISGDGTKDNPYQIYMN